MAKKLLFVPVLAAVFLFSGCDAEKASDSVLGGKAGYKAGVSSNHFGFGLYEKLREKEGNHFFSPFSVFSALSVAAEGARDNTWEEMRAALKLQPGAGAGRDSFLKLIDTVNKPGREFKLKTVNDLWVERSMRLLSSYTDTAKKYYLSGVNSRDFIGRPEEARLDINGYIERQTEKRIKDLLPRGSVDSDTRLIITNAIYFKADWLLEFEPSDTRRSDFFVSRGNSVKVDMMNMKRRGVIEDYYGKAKVLELPYAGEDASMLIFLPEQGAMAELEAEMTFEKYNSWMGSQSRGEDILIDLSLPKFKYESEYALKGALAEMGINSAFSERSADFSGITGSRNLFISDVVHKAFVAVDEKGTEAAAATGVVMKATSMPPPGVPFTVNRPFIFIIKENNSGAVLFMGRVVKPGGGS